MLKGTVVLVVDSDLATQDLIQEVLVSRGASVISAGTGWEGLLLIKRSPPDVLLSALDLPEMDGYAMIKSIRQLEQGNRVATNTDVHLPAAAMSPLTSPEDRRKSIAAGFRFHIAKPIDVAELANTVATLAGRAG